MKVELSLHATNLPNVAGAFKGTSDPYAVLTHVATTAGKAPEVLGKTEVVKNTLSPAWTKVFVIDYELGEPNRVVVSIFDEVRKGDNKPMGSAVFDVGELLGARGNTKARKLKKGGTVFATVRKSQGQGLLRLKLKGTKLKNVEGWIGKSDPFYELARKVDAAGGLTWDNIYRSKKVKDDLNPVWDPAAVELSTLCGGDLDLPLQVSVFDFESNGKHVSMGKFETSVNGLQDAASNGTSFELINNSKNVGQIEVTQAEVIDHSSASAEERLTAVSVDSAPAIKPSFVDYVSGGCELNVVVAIDFTGSNGNPRQPGTLHYMNPDGQTKNDYEKAIMAICQILSKYDSDQKFPVLGFGAKYDGVVRHAFQCGPEEEVHGVPAILEAYRQVFSSGLIMSGPTVFTEVIETAAARAISLQEAAQDAGKQAYSILLIISDGAVSDAAATAETLQQVADAPLSIVIVGVGDADFSAMEFLDDISGGEGSGQRDIAQFVQFNKHASCSVDLTSATLREIPDQLVAYFQSKGIEPLPAIRASEGEILVEEEEEEIDLTLDIGEDDEIVVASGGTDVRDAFAN